VVKNGNKTRSKAEKPKRRRQVPKLINKEERILRAATIYLIRKVGGLLVATGVREERDSKGSRTWIITVTLRYPTGHEGYVGELLYDGTDFSLLTPDDVMKERARKIAADPALQREWDEYRTPRAAGAALSGEQKGRGCATEFAPTARNGHRS